VGIVYDQADAVDFSVEVLKVLGACFIIVDQLGVYEPKADILQTTVVA
jgi:hypothetical protein